MHTAIPRKLSLKMQHAASFCSTLYQAVLFLKILFLPATKSTYWKSLRRFQKYLSKGKLHILSLFREWHGDFFFAVMVKTPYKLPYRWQQPGIPGIGKCLQLGEGMGERGPSAAFLLPHTHSP